LKYQSILADLLPQQQTIGAPHHLAIRSYRPGWNSRARSRMPGRARQALMVKHLVTSRAAVLAARHSVLEKYTASQRPWFKRSTANQ
jgi:hypothetical protein